MDLDVLEEGGSNWESILDSCQVRGGQVNILETERAHIANLFSSMSPQTDRRPIKTQGLNCLSATDKIKAVSLLKELAKYGLFLVPGGELESWLPHKAATGHGPDWLVSVFSKIGQSESDTNYLKAGNDDVWEFLTQIADWVNDQKRLGTD